jgi:hypothetical protein
MFIAMEEILVVFRNLEHENQTLHEIIIHLQTNQVSISLGCVLATQPQPKEPWINLLDKFDGTVQHSKFCQSSVFGHPISSSWISNWPSSS